MSDNRLRSLRYVSAFERNDEAQTEYVILANAGRINSIRPTAVK